MARGTYYRKGMFRVEVKTHRGASYFCFPGFADSDKCYVFLRGGI